MLLVSVKLAEAARTLASCAISPGKVKRGVVCAAAVGGESRAAPANSPHQARSVLARMSGPELVEIEPVIRCLPAQRLKLRGVEAHDLVLPGLRVRRAPFARRGQ